MAIEDFIRARNLLGDFDVFKAEVLNLDVELAATAPVKRQRAVLNEESKRIQARLLGDGIRARNLLEVGECFVCDAPVSPGKWYNLGSDGGITDWASGFPGDQVLCPSCVSSHALATLGTQILAALKQSLERRIQLRNFEPLIAEPGDTANFPFPFIKPDNSLGRVAVQLKHAEAAPFNFEPGRLTNQLLLKSVTETAAACLSAQIAEDIIGRSLLITRRLRPVRLEAGLHGRWIEREGIGIRVVCNNFWDFMPDILYGVGAMPDAMAWESCRIPEANQ